MCDRRERRAIGIVADERPTARLAEPIEAEGHEVVTGDPSEVCAADPEFVVAVGDRAVLALAREEPTTPVVPIAAEAGVGSVAAAEASTAIEAALADDVLETDHPLVGVRIGDETVGPALMDVTLVTAEPARISEYAVDHDGDRVATVRADGIVVATPAGSRGYAAAAGGPTIGPGTGVVCVVPIAPFHTNADSWVLDVDGVGLSVLRDESTVSMFVDDREYGPVGRDSRVELEVRATMRVLFPGG